MSKNFKGNWNGNGKKSSKKPYKTEYNFHDWCVARELKALDKAWENEMQDIYGRYFDSHRYSIHSEDENKHKEYLDGVEDALNEELEEVTRVYKEKRKEIKEKFKGKDNLTREVYDSYKLDSKEEANELRKMSLDGLEDIEWNEYTADELKEAGIIKGTLAKGRLHPDDIGKPLTVDMLDRVIWESMDEDVEEDGEGNNGAES